MSAIPAGYKLTGVGIIPENWKVRQFGELAATVASGRSKVDAAFGKYAVHGSTGVIGYCEVPEYEGDAILVARVGANAGKLNTVAGKYGVTDNTIIVRVRGESSLSFFYRQLESKRLNSLVFGSGQPLITGSQLKALLVCEPPLPEQRSIAAALSDVDALLAKLDQLIAKKRDLKQAAMQQLLTGQTRLPGFEKNKGYKQTEVGMIPVDWDVVTLGDIGQCLIGLTYKPSNIKAHGTLVLRSSNVQEGALAFDDNVYVDAEIPERIRVQDGDILVCVRNGSRALIGKCAMLDHRVVNQTFGAFMSVFRTSDSAFIFQQFQSNLIKRQINENIGATINQITNANLNSFMVPLPTNIEERQTIATILSDMDAELAALEARRDKTRALKQGMMQELLTGRIRLVSKENRNA